MAARLRTVVTRLFRRVERTRAGAALTPSQTTVLAGVVRRGPLHLSELAFAEGLNPTMLSRLVHDLEAAGLVERWADRADHRAVLVAATPAGKGLHEHIRSERSDILSVALARLSNDERQALGAGLPVLEALAEELKGRQA
jgi:DNA-binding MarR family transcriptional regulator